FLDEIGDMDKGVQARILRVLEERQVMRIASDSFIPVDIRVIAATHNDLASHVQSGSLRLDLFYRLNVLTLNVPPLRERQGDILMLARYFAQRYCHEHGKQIEDIPADIFDVLAKYHWPGNIRQLKNVMERVVLSCGHRTSGRWDLELMIPELRVEMVQQDMQPVADADRILGDSLEEIKRGAVRRVLWEEKGNKTKAAKRLGVDRSTVERLM
ncbi:MAG: sigma 54-interacting transcriptional regulator, partial [Syntrophobacteraceae bacterium]